MYHHAEKPRTEEADELDHVNQARREYVRNRIMHDHLHSVLRKTPGFQTFPQSLALSAISAASTTDVPLPGGITTDDLHGLTPVPPPVPNDYLCRLLEAELARTLVTVAEYWDTDKFSATNDDDKLGTALQLPVHVQERRTAIKEHESALKECRVRVLRLIERINEVQPALESKLSEALGTHPPQLRATHAAHADVIAATIEAALLKLSLVRARAHRALYGHSPLGRPDATVSRAVSAAYERLREREKAQEAEMARLDRQIEEYERMLRLVDGKDGSFAQVVKDMARVKRETDECRKDLRRLGWTGD